MARLLIGGERASSKSPERPPIEWPERKKSPPVVWFALAGAISVAFNVYLLAAWIGSGDAYAQTGGSDPVPTYTKVFAAGFQVLMPALLVALLVHLWRKSKREGRTTWDFWLTIPFITCLWQDTVVNFLRPVFFWNSYMVNLGAWNPHIPGWISPNARNTPEPLLFQTFTYGFWFYGGALIFAFIGRRAVRYRPNIGKTGVFLLGAFSIALMDVIAECLWIRTRIFSYPSVTSWLALFPGTPNQFPLYECVIVGVWSATIGMIRLNRDDKGQSAVERGIESLNLSNRRRATVTFLAFCGLANLLYIPINVAYIGASLYVNTHVKNPSYLTNGLCGEGTGVPCPTLSTPIYMPDSPRWD